MPEALGPDKPDIHAFLSQISGETTQFGSSYMLTLGKALHEVDPNVLPHVLADVITEAPTDNESWLAYNVKAGYAENLYPGAALAAFACAAEDPKVAEALTAQLDTVDDKTILPRLASVTDSIHIRILSTAGASAEACATLSSWVLNRTHDDKRIVQFVRGIKQSRLTTDQLVIFQEALQAAGHGKISTAIDAVLAGRREQEARAAEAAAAREAADRDKQRQRAAEEMIRQAVDAQRERIAQDPFAAMTEFARDMNIASRPDIEALSQERLEQLIYVAHVTLNRGDTIRNRSDEQTAAIELALVIMDQASHLQRTGNKLAGYPNAYYVEEHEKRPMILARSEADFWDELAKYAEWHDVKPSAATGFYVEWKDQFVTWQRYERARKVFANLDASPADYLPEGCANIEVMPYGATVNYDDIDTLLTDMRRYYIPRSQRFDSLIASADLVITSSGASTPEGLGLLQAINQASNVTDVGNMDRIEQEVREWLETGEEYYRDSYDLGSGDPYKYMITTFSGQGIGIRRNEQGQFVLSIEGRGYNTEPNNPAGFIENFAIINDREMNYGNGFRIVYTADIPDVIEKHTRKVRDEDWEFVRMDVPVGKILETLGKTLGVEIDNIDEMARTIVEGDDYPGATFALGDYSVRIQMHGWDKTYDAEHKRAITYEVVFDRGVGGKYVKLTETQTDVSVQVKIPEALQHIVQRVVAAKTLIHSRPMHDRSTTREILSAVEA